VDVRHLVATPAGREVTGHAEVVHTRTQNQTQSLGYRTALKTSAPGTHERTVVNVAGIIQKNGVNTAPDLRRSRLAAVKDNDIEECDLGDPSQTAVREARSSW